MQVRTIFSKLIDSIYYLLNCIINFIFPPRCAVCKNRLEKNERIVCESCWSNITLIREPYCYTCSKPYGDRRFDHTRCLHSKEPIYSFTQARAAAILEGTLSDIIYQLKYYRKPSLATRLGKMMYDAIKDIPSYCEAEIIVPVPLHKNRLRKRGYNQSELLAKEIAKGLQLPLSNNSVVRIKDTKSQTQLPPKQRIENVHSAFKVKNNVLIKGKKIILVDDVITTGATLNSCTEELLNAGAKEVIIIATAAAV